MITGSNLTLCNYIIGVFTQKLRGVIEISKGRSKNFKGGVGRRRGVPEKIVAFLDVSRTLARKYH